MITTYEQAKRLKELGYDKPTYQYLTEKFDYHFNNDKQTSKNHNAFDGVYSAPSLSEALQWIREKYEICCTVELINYEDYQRIVTYLKKYRGVYLTDDDYEFAVTPNDFDTYPEAESAILDELLTYLEQKR